MEFSPLRCVTLSLTMITHVLILFSLNLFGLESATAATTSGNDTDWLALLEFKKQITDDPLGVLSSWNGSVHLCDWHGVTCGRRRRQRIIGLNLEGKKLVGTLSPHIGNLSLLSFINLQNNSFHGSIPQEVSRLSMLRDILLNNNSFGGEIPHNLSHCSNLKHLTLHYNRIEGKIPVELGSLTHLVNLSLGSNNLTGGIPYSIGNLTSLEHLSFEGNSLGGNIPNIFNQMKRLKHLEFELNDFFGIIPPSVYNLSSLTLIALTGNKLNGSLRPNIGLAFPNLQFLWVGDNQFSGPIPFSLSNASGLIEIDIPGNNFTGPVPMDLGSIQTLQWLGLGENPIGRGEADDLNFITSLINCSDLWTLSLYDCNFGGMLPSSIANLSTQLIQLSFTGNQIIGGIPIGIENLVKLISLEMDNNLLTGSIPDSIGRLSKLQLLSLSGNRLTGQIPPSLGNMTQLVYLDLYNNNLRGRIPPSLVNCQGLQEVYLSHNKLNGTIPKEVIGLSSLSIILDVSHNSLTGSLPLEVGSLKNLGHLDVSYNRMTGEIPSTLGNCLSLEHLYMQGNFFQGTIPSSLSNLKAIQDLDLSNNNLSGSIPKSLGGLPLLQYLNLSFNSFEGEVPVVGVFLNVTAVSVDGNRGLCGGIPELKLQPCPMEESMKKGKSLTFKLVTAIVSVILGLTLILALFFVCWRRKPKGISSSEPLVEECSTPPFGEWYLKVSYRDLFKATEGFSSGNLIGSGGYGTVYKGILHNNTIAVKVLNTQQRGASKSFMTECEAVRNIRHRNLIKIITACSSMDLNGNDFKALVFEFMPNGSLEEWLHPGEEKNSQSRKLNFLVRLNIAIDVASALHYLHYQCEAPIVHCDLKSSNVLLDNDMTACVSDFGMSRLLSNSTKKLTQKQFSSFAIKGTIGYAAPEYGMGAEVSTHGDVYSYGILLLEMFTGKRPTAEIFKDGLNLHNYCKMALSERVMEIADPLLLLYGEEIEQNGEKETATNNEYLSGSGHKMQECLIFVIRIGVACSAELPRERMDMNEVTREMNSIRNTFLGARY
ncbi:PREDICTED: putative receptor-like protein kinase At3g47110 [Nelumbo nucifera]|uniref:non-specific serine/threonine protein kinase n=2 Tax=Nelumbo nucifera TaxID=4432 RepID=A0A1U7ZU50_NELNU|nr:PREDICTED: putative receptor-like protein kinase At3g47110 [Nelumbo nucifera]DAD26685.1 TPA_asm: hypothetical protein HUJ06_028153 [Nelumbo nucifera]